MQILYQRAGGFSGMVISLDLQTEILPSEEAHQLIGLVEAADFFNLPSKIISSGLERDRFLYTVTVAAKEQQHTIEVEDSAAPDSLRPLLEKLRLISRSANRR